MSRERKLIPLEERRKNVLLLSGVAMELAVGIPWLLDKQALYQIDQWKASEKRYLSAIQKHIIKAKTATPIVTTEAIEGYKKGTFFVNYYPILTVITLTVQSGIQGKNMLGAIQANRFDTQAGKEMQVINLSKTTDPKTHKEYINLNSARWPISIPSGQFPYQYYNFPANNLNQLPFHEIDQVIYDITSGIINPQEAQNLYLSNNRSLHIADQQERNSFIKDCCNLFQSIGEAI